MEVERIQELCERNGKVIQEAYLAERRQLIAEAVEKRLSLWDCLNAKKSKKARAHTVKCQERAAHRFEMGYADKFGHTLPHIVTEIVVRYQAGGVTFKKLGDEYGLSPGRIRQLVAREQKRGGPKPKVSPAPLLVLDYRTRFCLNREAEITIAVD